MAEAAPVTATLVPSDDDELTQRLKELEDRVQRMASAEGLGLEFRPGLDIADVQAYMIKIQSHAAEKESSDSFSKARKALDKTLQCIKTVGGIATDGVSKVFQPASGCYNALFFVIQAWQGYCGIFESLTKLLDGCIAFLDRLSDYVEANVSAKLRRVACQQLSLFVDICDHTLKMRQSKRFKTSAFMKVMFLDDDGVRGFLAQMESLYKTELALGVSQTLLVVSNVKKDTETIRTWNETLMTDREEIKKGKDENKWRKTLLRSLEFEEKQDGGGPDKLWEKRWRQLKKETAPGSGDWLQHNEKFDSWVNRTDPNKPVLTLEGGDGVGKSHLAANIIRRLQQQYNVNGSTVRPLVAYYFAENDSKAAPQSKASVADTVSRSLLWQFAESYTPFLKSAAAICTVGDKGRILNGAEDMWKQLLLENRDLLDMNAVFFIVVDGLPDEHIGFLVPLLRDLTRSSIAHCGKARVLITGKPEACEVLATADGGIGMEALRLDGNINVRDVELYAEWRMDGMEFLLDRKLKNVAETRAKALSTFKGSAGGNLRKICDILDKISSSDDIPFIESILENAAEEAAVQLELDIQRINRTGTPRMIADINEMILWVLSAIDWLKPAQLEAALALKGLVVELSMPAHTGPALSSGDQPVGASLALQPNSLSSLDFKLRKGRYPIFEIDKEGDVNFRAGLETAEKRIPKRQNIDEGGSLDADTKAIKEVEVDMVKHYLHTICPAHVYDKFGFESFFAEKLARKTNYIFQDPKNAMLALALRCLTCLVEKRTVSTEALREYAAGRLYKHLYDAEFEEVISDDDPKKVTVHDGLLALADQDLKAQVGKLLVRLFTEDYAIDSFLGIGCPIDDDNVTWLGTYFIPLHWHDWIVENAGLELMTKYFKDRVIQEDIKTHEFVVAFNSAGTDALRVLLEPATKAAARHLVRSDATSLEYKNAFLFLLAAKAKLDSKNMEDDDQLLEFINNPSLDRIEDVETWSRNLVGLTGDSSVWESHMAMVLDRFTGRNVTKKHVEVRAQKALDMDATNWEASYTLARVLEAHDEAIKVLNDLIVRLSADNTWRSPQKKAVLAEMLLELGDRNWASSKGSDEAEAAAIDAYSRSLDEHTKKYQNCLEVISKYADRKLWKEILSLLERMGNTSKESAAAMGKLAEAIVQYRSPSQSVSRHLRDTAMDLGCWDFVKRIYKTGLDEKGGIYETHCHIQLHFGYVLLGDPSSVDDGLDLWDKIVANKTPEDGEPWVELFFDKMVQLVLPIYTSRAQSAQDDREPAISLSNAAASRVSYEKRVNALRQRLSTIGQSYKNPIVALHFARFYHILGETGQAKELAREPAMQALEMISNDDPSDDYYSFWILQRLFSVFGDVPNALAACNMMEVATRARQLAYVKAKREWEEAMEKWKARQGPKTQQQTLESSDEGLQGESKNVTAQLGAEGGDGAESNGVLARESATIIVAEAEILEIRNSNTAIDKEELPLAGVLDKAPEEPIMLGFSVVATCNACHEEWSHPSDIWTCMDDCGSVLLHTRCYDKFKENNLELPVCDRRHEFYHIPEQDRETIMEGVDIGSVRVGGVVISLEEWKRQIKRQYVDVQSSSYA